MVYDVIISGAGPAGAITAYTCAKAGLDVLLLDKATFPREIPCGGGISVRSNNLLQYAGIDLPSHLIEQQITGLEFMDPRMDPFVIRSTKPLGYTVQRKHFDDFLVKQAVKQGVRFIDTCPLQQFQCYPGHVTVHTRKEDFESHLLVGADGVSSIVGRLSGLRQPLTPKSTGVGLEVDVPISARILSEVLDPSVLVFWFLNIPSGYFWVFPRKTSLSFGVGGRAAKLGNVPELLKRLATMFTTQRGMPPLSIPKIRGRILPALKNPVLDTTDCIILVGDAAGLVDIFTGQGICYALESGFIAANTVIKAVKNKCFTKRMLSEYTRIAQRRFGEELRESWSVANMVHGHLNLIFRLTQKMRSTHKVLLDIIAGQTDYYRIRRNLMAFTLRCMLDELRYLIVKKKK